MQDTSIVKYKSQACNFKLFERHKICYLQLKFMPMMLEGTTVWHWSLCNSCCMVQQSHIKTQYWEIARLNKIARCCCGNLSSLFLCLYLCYDKGGKQKSWQRTYQIFISTPTQRVVLPKNHFWEHPEENISEIHPTSL